MLMLLGAVIGEDAPILFLQKTRTFDALQEETRLDN